MIPGALFKFFQFGFLLSCFSFIVAIIIIVTVRRTAAGFLANFRQIVAHRPGVSFLQGFVLHEGHIAREIMGWGENGVVIIICIGKSGHSGVMCLLGPQ